jgi:hypothetical protein
MWLQWIRTTAAKENSFGSKQEAEGKAHRKLLTSSENERMEAGKGK